MWKRIAVVVLALSLALNAAFTVTWAVRTFSGGARSQPPGAGAGQEGEIWSALHRRLGVSREQWKKIEPHMRAFMEKMEDRQERISKVRHEMLDLLFSKDVSREAIEKQQDRVLKAFRKTQNLVLEHVLTERKYLTDEQEREMKRMLEERMDTSGPGRPPIGRGGGAGGRGVGKAFRRIEKEPEEGE